MLFSGYFCNVYLAVKAVNFSQEQLRIKEACCPKNFFIDFLITYRTCR